MRLEAIDVGAFLLARGLLEPRDIVEGRFRVQDVSSRNRVYLASAETGPSYVLKDAHGREAAVIDALRASGLADVVPEPVLHQDGVLVLKAPPGARDVVTNLYSRGVAGAAGRALRRLHALDPCVIADPADPGWPLRLHRPHADQLETLSAGGVELLKLIQASPEICDGLDSLATTWKPSAPVHGDVRLANLLAVPPRPGAHRTRLLVIDWEAAGRGDPALDAGAYLGEYLHAWVRSVPIVDPDDPGRLLQQAGRPLARLQPVLQAFWDAYANRDDRFRLRAVRYAATRLVVAALEEAQNLARLGGCVRYTLQLSANVFRRPGDAADGLLGIG